MKCKAVKKFLLDLDHPENLNGEVVEHIENCAACSDYFNKISEMRRSLGERKEYSNRQMDFSFSSLKRKAGSAGKDRKYEPWMNHRRNKLAAGLLVLILLLSIPTNKTIAAMELLNRWKDRISISSNNKEIAMEVGEHEVDLPKENPEAYQLLTERNQLIDEILSRKSEKEAYAEIDEIIKKYDERLKALDYTKLNPKPRIYKHFKNMEDLQKEVVLDKAINPAMPELFQLEKITYSEYGEDYKRLDLQYDDYNDENRINHQKRSLGITYVFQKESEENDSYSFQKGSKLVKISIGKYEGYILEKSNEQYSSLCVGVFMNDCQLTVYSKSKLEDMGETENMLIEIAKSIANSY